MPLAFECGVVTLLPKHMPDGGNVGRQLMDPREVGVVPQPCVLGMDPGPHGSSRGCADRHGTVLPVETYSLRLEALHGGELNVGWYLHMGVPLIHTQNDD